MCVRLELGPQDLAKGSTLAKRRDAAEKRPMPLDTLADELPRLLDQMQADLLARATQSRDERTVVASSFDEVRDILAGATAEKGGGKFVMVHLDDDPANEAKLSEIKASTRNYPLEDRHGGAGPCILTGKEVSQRVIVAKAY